MITFSSVHQPDLQNNISGAQRLGNPQVLRFAGEPVTSANQPPQSAPDWDGLIGQLKDLFIGRLRALFVQVREIFENIGEMLGFHKPLRVPRMLTADAYTAASENFISQDAKDYSVYHVALRRQMTPWMKEMGVKPENAKYVFTGLQHIMNDLLKDPVTKQEIDEADKFFKSAKRGGEFKWDRRVWDRVVNECNGIIPIKIEALPDGSVAFPGEPIMQVTAKDGYGELAAWFETKLLQVWATSERASLVRHWLEYNKDLVKRCDGDLGQRLQSDDPKVKAEAETELTQRAQKMLVDFSDRSSMTAEESQTLGLANLTAFPTTSTIAAAYAAWKDSGEQPAGSLSMYSLAHRVVESFKKEPDAYKSLYKFTQGDIASYVADCYNYRNAVKTMLLPLALDAKKAAENGGPTTVICARPDSGDPFWEIMYVLNLAVQNGLYKEVTAADGTKLKAMTNLRVIQADGMSFKKMQQINERLIKAGFSPPDCVYYGVGGGLHDSLSRSNTSAAMKLAEVGSEHRKVMKSPKGEPAKESIPGRVKICREPGKPTVRSADEPGENVLQTWYDGTDGGPGVLYQEPFNVVRDRVLNDFNAFPKPEKDKLLSEAIQQNQAEVRLAHHGPQKH